MTANNKLYTGPYVSHDPYEFKFRKLNREIRPLHVDEMIASIKEVGWMEIFPILVNERKEIIHGQHRVTALRQLREQGIAVDCNYMIFHGTEAQELDLIARANEFHLKEQSADLIPLYAYGEGNENYAKLAMLVDEGRRLGMGLREIYAALGCKPSDIKGRKVNLPGQIGDYMALLGELRRMLDALGPRNSIYARRYILAIGFLDRFLEAKGRDVAKAHATICKARDRDNPTPADTEEAVKCLEKKLSRGRAGEFGLLRWFRDQ